ncbi:MAG TPA: class 1 fructose-bisphosphatase [Methylophilaceae bacterium]|nr:class 1 fructose-bisphosphatase [Methylophilaceae bacterium]
MDLKSFLADHALAPLIADIAEACRQTAVQVSKGALLGQMGSLGSQNVQGETQKHLDVIANDIWLQVNERHGHYAGMASEELEAPYAVPPQHRQHGRYLLLFDPLDGSSNVDLNFTVGSIFSILEAPREPLRIEDFLQPGTRQLAAGYALYGTSTMLVLTTGEGVHGFTLDEATGDFMRTHPQMHIPPDTAEFAINMSRQRLWSTPVQQYVAECLQGAAGPRGKDFNMRWVASMVAEVHRILVRGGVFMYPMDDKLRAQGGRLRLMYEANPMAMLVEQAGGLAIDGSARILDLQPTTLHQRVPVLLGSRHEIDYLLRLHQAR